MARIVVETTPTLLTLPETDSTPGSAVILKNTGTVTVYMEFSVTPTVADGYPLAAGEWIGVDLGGRRDTLRGRVATGTGEVRLLQTGI